MNIYQDIYQEAFKDELEKIALKSTPEEIALENKQEDELNSILENRPALQKIMYPALAFGGLGAGVAAKKIPLGKIGKTVGRYAKKSKFLLPLAGLLAGSAYAGSINKTLPWWKKYEKAEKKV